MALCRTLSLRGVRSKTLLILQKSCKHNKKCLLKKNTDKRERTNLCEKLTLMTHTAFICSNYSHEKKSKIRIVWWQLCYFVVGWVGFEGFLHWGEHTEGWGGPLNVLIERQRSAGFGLPHCGILLLPPLYPLPNVLQKCLNSLFHTQWQSFQHLYSFTKCIFVLEYTVPYPCE